MFLKGIIGNRAVHRSADDHVVDEMKIHLTGCESHFFSEELIAFAGRSEAGGMVVGEDEIDRLIDNRGVEDVAHGGKGLVGGAAANFPHFQQSSPGGEGEDVEFFFREVG